MLFDGVTPAELPKANALYLDPRGPGGPVRVEGALKTPGFDKVDRKHPAVRFLALDDVNVAEGHKLVPESGDKVLGAADAGASPILVAGTRAGFKFVALGFDVRQSDLPLRIAWPLFVLDCINWFTDEDSEYLSAYRTGEVWRIPLGGAAAKAVIKMPDGSSQPVAVHEGRAVLLGEHAGFYEVREEGDEGARPVAFAANLLDAEESAIAPQDQLTVDGKGAGELAGFHFGVRREILGVPAAGRRAPHGARVGHVPPEGHGVTTVSAFLRRWASRLAGKVSGALAVFVFAVGLWAYLRYVWYAGPTLAWARRASEYELMAPRMLGIALLAPYFSGWSGVRSPTCPSPSARCRSRSGSRSSACSRSAWRASRARRRRRRCAPSTSST